MKMYDNILLSVYKKMRKLYLLEQENIKRSRCECDISTKFYASAHIENARNRGSIRIGKNTHIRGDLRTFGRNGKILLGDECFLGENSYIWSIKGISIGNRVLISHNCNVFDNDTHPKNCKLRNRQFRAIIAKGQPQNANIGEKEVVIEDDVLICANCTILKGCRIGEKSIIGVGSVVNRDIPPKSIAYGNPLKIKKNESEF